METSQQIHKRFVEAYNDFMFANTPVKPSDEEYFEPIAAGLDDPLY